MKALIAVDGSPDSITALRTAARLTAPRDRQFDLLCVAPRFQTRSGGTRLDYERRILSETTQILEQARASIPARTATLNLLTEVGSAAAAIVSRSGDYDLTVIGPKGRGTAASAGLGPVAGRAVEHAEGPVLVGRELRSDDAPRVLIAVDGSGASRHAIETAASLFDLEGAEVCLMHVVETPWIQFGLEDDWATFSDEDKEHSEAGAMEKEMVKEGGDVIEQARDLLRGRRISISTRIDEGTPANEILSEAQRGPYDLIVLGATGTRDLKHTMLGSVSTRVAWDAPCSVLIVREPD